MNGHFHGTLNGLCVHPKQEAFYTVGDDSILFKWSLSEKKCLGTMKLNS